MNKNFLLLLLSTTCAFFSCKTEEPPVVSYQLQVDNELANDTIDHSLSYKFEVINSQNSNRETGTWELQLLKQDAAYFTVIKEDNCQIFTIPAGSLIEKIPTDQLLEYDGLRIKGRLFFQKENEQVSLEKAFTVWGKPAKPIFNIISAEENGYPDEMNVIFGFVCNGATSIRIRHHNDDYGYIDNYYLNAETYYETFNDLDMTTVNEFLLYASNFLGTTISDPIYIGGAYTLSESTATLSAPVAGDL